jgi:hypothetical protein
MIKAMFVTACALAVCAFGTATAQGAPQLELTSGGPPKVLVPGESSTGQLTFTNTGDAPVPANSATITVQLPSALTATGASATLWSCSIEPLEMRLITCTGPAAGNSILPGSSLCTGFFANPCPISISVKGRLRRS